MGQRKKNVEQLRNRIFIQVWPPEATMGIAFRSTLKQNINTNRKNGEIKYFSLRSLIGESVAQPTKQCVRTHRRPLENVTLEFCIKEFVRNEHCPYYWFCRIDRCGGGTVFYR
jgi:hypothetical protein